MPNSVYTKVDPDRLSMAALRIEDSLRLVENALNAVDDSLRNTLLPTWSGPACDQFFSQYTVDSSNFKSLMDTMRAYNEKLRLAAGVYGSADDTAGDLVNSLRI